MPAVATLSPSRIRVAESALSAADPHMGALIAAHGPCRLRREPPFHVLAVSIINQQLSQKAADTIEARVAKIVPAPFAAETMAKAPPQKLRAAGLSGSKARYLNELGRRVCSGMIPLAEFARMEDEAVIASLSTAPGIGRWTAEMFLLFALKRPDVLALGDAALRRAARNLYGRRFRGNDEEVLAKAARRWRPYRTIGCWYLWRSLGE